MAGHIVTSESVRTSPTFELASSFSRIHKLPQLETINLTFFPDYANWKQAAVDPDGKDRIALQTSILAALAASFSFRVRAPLRLMSLSLHSLRTWDLDHLESPSFQAVLKNMQHFPDPNTASERCVHFWGTVLPRRVIAPMQHSLTELTLHNDGPLGASSRLSLARLHFAYLCAISLRGLVFEPSVGFEPFILRHAPTLARFELIACMLPIHDNDDLFPSPSPFPPPSVTLRITRNEESDLRPAQWARIWDSFAAKLTALTVLHVDSDRRHTELVCRYVRPGPMLAYELSYLDLPLKAADSLALICFHKIVADRSKETPDKP
jgi:hypothetical protein